MANKFSAAGNTGVRVLAFAAALALPMGYAVAKPRHSHEAAPSSREYVGLYQNPAQALNVDQQDHRLFDRSGTVGREGLGESPFHPEGPGNVAN